MKGITCRLGTPVGYRTELGEFLNVRVSALPEIITKLHPPQS